ncbi:MAG: mechanosensitive ion channel family protein [Candidatus Cloacimonadaceae bacterium]|jgi:small conductance mechanosensitive channel
MNPETVTKVGSWERLLDQIPHFLATNGLKLVAAILIYVIGKWVAKLVAGLLRKLLNKSKLDATLVTFVSNIVYALILTFVIIAAIGKLGVQTTSLVAIVGAAGLAVGMALQGSLSNFASGVMLILFKPFKVGDKITAAGTTGVVQEIGIFHTTIITSDNTKIIVPNSPIAGGAITNYSAMPTRRIELSVSVPGASDMAKVSGILQNILEADERILKDPAPAIVISSATPGEIVFGVYPHVNNEEMAAVQASLNEQIKLRLTAEGIWN